ncbi:hypothetical protein [Clostridium minihomine]|uniref:hypothetical protein n=1 Tax=Clostridium minihomine TaxID=2045012 RepID=UPI000C757AA3|nr:hypothetical protein [Clostridium minihomine]
MEVNYKFVPQYKSAEAKEKSDMISYAEKLLEIVGCSTLIVGIDRENKPFVYACDSPLQNALDFRLDTY